MIKQKIDLFLIVLRSFLKQILSLYLFWFSRKLNFGEGGYFKNLKLKIRLKKAQKMDITFKNHR